MAGQPGGAEPAVSGGGGPGLWPLSRLLSQVLVAFTIEADNEAEHRMPHRTTSQGRSAGAPGPWLVSLVMWENCLRYLTEDGITVAGLARAARTPTNLDGMRRWGYLRVDPPPPRKPGPGSVLYPTRAGLAAQQVWRPVLTEVEARWQNRFGATEVDGLRGSLRALAAELPASLPDALPILGHGLYTRGRGPGDDQFPGLRFPGTAVDDGAGSAVDDLPGSGGVPDAGLPLPALLSRVLVAFAVEYERESATSLAISANVLRVLGDGWTPVRDLPALTGVSKEAVSMATGFLAKHGRAETGPVPTPGRGQRIRLTPSGRQARDQYGPLTAAIEDRWRARWGDALIGDLRARLERLAHASAAQTAPGGLPLLMRGLEPYPDGWRAKVRRPEVLPHYPMVLHRGGYPDGS
jgi:DNA-binding MarR family transcriptional regulator